jgi:DNA-directed RNA polymerase specialized sigma24 family protein
VSKLQEENSERLDTLYRYSHKWLIGAAFKISKNLDVANELVSDLYLYLAERLNTAIWFDDETGRKSFNLLYLRAFLQTRFLNRIKASKKHVPFNTEYYDTPDEEYDYEFEDRVNNSYKEMLTELDNLKTTRLWAPAKLFEIYSFTEGMTLDKLADEIGICRSTAFGNTKKIKLHLRNKINNPFKPIED